MSLEVLGVALLALLIGAAFTFAGFKFFLFLLPVWAFFMGFLAGAQGMTALFGDGFLAEVTGWVIGFGLGLVFAVLSYLFYWVAVVLLGASIGYSVGVGVMGAIGLDLDLVAFVVGIAIGVTGALLVIVLRVPRYLVIVLTAAGGATAILAGVLLLLGRIDLGGLTHGIVGAAVKEVQGDPLWAIGWVVLLGAGILYQVRSTMEMDERLSRETYRYG